MTSGSNHQRELAVVVLSLRSPPELLDAVASLLVQEVGLEVVVVNSGGGEPDRALRSAGLDVPVVDEHEVLYPGAARNVGIDATCAPFVAFLAADCVAQPGWAANRLRRHREGAEAVSSAVTAAERQNRSSVATQVLLYARRSPHTPRALWAHYGVSYGRGLFDRFGRFRPDLRTGEDTELHSRFGERVEIVAARDVCVAHRHPESVVGLVRDQFRRGRLSGRAWADLDRSRRLATPSRPGLAQARALLKIARMRASAEELSAIDRAVPWVYLGAVANRAGRLIG